MTRRHLLAALASALLAAQLSCAASTAPPLEESAVPPRAMPAARQGLLPEFRIFYDALQDYGDWTLIEPFGWVFRPSVNFVAWRPYTQGFWVPSDVYGWVWVSTEPFGWVTFHYGTWMFDRFQGWVWVPGVSWAPAQVSWLEAGNYVGWAPLAPPGGSYSGIPGGAYVFAPLAQLGSTDLQTRTVTSNQIAKALANVRAIENTTTVNGVEIERGPRFDAVERATGFRVAPVKMDERTLGQDLAPAPAGGKGAGDADAIAATRRAAVQAAREARALIANKAAVPAILPVLKPVLQGRAESRHAPPAPLPVSAARDSTH